MSKSQADMLRIASLDDYQTVALELADWSALADRATLTVFSDHASDFSEIVSRLEPFDIMCVMRERTPLSRDMGLPVNVIVADILRIDNGILVEHWDVIQDEATEERSKSKAPMFGSSNRRECVAKLCASEAHNGLNGPEKHSQGEPNCIAPELH
jgi:hypothetical protein